MLFIKKIDLIYNILIVFNYITKYINYVIYTLNLIVL